ncbi:hypothetical protein IGI04_014881 [Brassica rapa subsp. trilocularis]|uniref:Uncharacterized protein n=1 Tax=Brassica rapa subsp. trilocularis TaxID=1813537 RepID=A0ABQ7MRW4_BRACM|nr:hypothetical protein IGI04_014881 [Brassica rapa subsp. trilocularis]
MSSLAKQVETLTAKSKPPRGATRVRRGRRLDFGSPGNEDKDAPRESTEQNPDETAPAGQRTTSDNLPPPQWEAKETTSNESTWTSAIDRIILTTTLISILEGPEVGPLDRQ